MEELVHGFYMILLMPDGLYAKEYFEFSRAMTLRECMDFTSDHRAAISTYYDKINRWLLNDESGRAWFGSECVQDPNRIDSGE